MQGLGGLLCLATVAIEALLSVMAAALSGFGLFFRVSFRWGHDDLLRIVMSSIPTYMKETMSHLASISKRQTRGEDAPAPPSYKPFMMNGFHGVSSENPHQCLLKFMFGKARSVLSSQHRPLVEVLTTKGKPMFPQQLLTEAGYDDDSIEDFYWALREEIAKGRIRENRLTESDVMLEAVSQ